MTQLPAPKSRFITPLIGIASGLATGFWLRTVMQADQDLSIGSGMTTAIAVGTAMAIWQSGLKAPDAGPNSAHRTIVLFLILAISMLAVQPMPALSRGSYFAIKVTVIAAVWSGYALGRWLSLNREVDER